MSIFSRKRRASTVAPRLAVADMGGGEYELTLYGDVMAADERDWWTGERTDEPAVTSEAINRELAELRNASHVTVRLNSCGGDLYAGLAIHDVLRSLPAEVTVRVEGVAASAASVIACAGDRVVVTPGSIFMVHEGALALCGYYTGADVRALAEDMDAGVRAMLGVYSAKTGRSVEELRPVVEAETWMVGQEIVDAGFADELEEYDGATLGSMGFGQGLAIPMVQMVRAYSAVANGGVPTTPHFLVTKGDEEASWAQQDRVISADTAAAEASMMQTVVDEGTAKNARIDGYQIAAKTGTGEQAAEGGGYASASFLGSLCGFVNVQDPEALVYVGLNGIPHLASDSSAHVFKEIMTQTISIMGISPVS